MSKVFISGSISIKKLNCDVISKIDNIINTNLTIFIGDANGVDSLVQTYLKNKNYMPVIVYCSGDKTRNNLGNWITKNIVAKSPANSRAFYTEKDTAMTNDCDYGLMVWDCKSTGTLNNALNLVKQNKKFWIYIDNNRMYKKVTSAHELGEIISLMSDKDFKNAVKKLNIKEQIDILTSNLDDFKLIP